MGHTCQAQGIQHCTHDDDAKGPKPVGQHAHKNAGHAPREVLDGNGKRKSFTTPVLLLGNGLQPEPKAVADAHRQGDDGSSADQQLGEGQGFG